MQQYQLFWKHPKENETVKFVFVLSLTLKENNGPQLRRLPQQKLEFQRELITLRVRVFEYPNVVKFSKEFFHNSQEF